MSCLQMSEEPPRCNYAAPRLVLPAIRSCQDSHRMLRLIPFHSCFHFNNCANTHGSRAVKPKLPTGAAPPACI